MGVLQSIPSSTCLWHLYSTRTATRNFRALRQGFCSSSYGDIKVFVILSDLIGSNYIAFQLLVVAEKEQLRQASFFIEKFISLSLGLE